jgi:hypothetical protein
VGGGGEGEAREQREQAREEEEREQAREEEEREQAREEEEREKRVDGGGSWREATMR